MMKKQKNKWAITMFMIGIGIILSLPSVALVRTSRIKFARDAFGAEVRGALVSMAHDRDIYLVGAGASQTMTVSISALEKNAVFSIRDPQAKYLKGAGATDDATFWRGKLLLSGDYKIEVGPSRGNATYKMKVEIK